MKIILGSFKDKSEELVSFLEPRVGTKPNSSGSEIEIDDSSLKSGVKSRHVKTYIKRFLHKSGQRKKYRVLVSGKELRLVELEGEEAEKEEEKKEIKRPEKAQEEKQEPAKREVKEVKPAKREAPKEEKKEKEAPEKPAETRKKPKKASREESK